MLSTETTPRRRKVVAAEEEAVAPAAKRKRRTQAERSELMRQRLITAASVIMRKKGYVNLRTDEVARVAKVSRGALHHHFATKDELVLALTEHLMQMSLQRNAERAHAVRTSPEAIEAMVLEATAFFMSPEFSILLDLLVASTKSPTLRVKVAEYARIARSSVESEWVLALQALGIERTAAERVVWLTFNMVRGFSVRALWQNDDQLFRVMVEHWKAMVATYLKELGVELT